MLCRHCDKECKNANSKSQHEIRCARNPNRIAPSRGMLGKKGKNQFSKARESGGKYERSSDSLAKLADAGRRQVWSAERRKKLSDIAKSRGLGGHTSKIQLHYRKRSGEEIFLQSSYEIRFAEILDALGFEWSRPDPLIWVDADGTDHRYYPDFKVGNIYFDTKNDYLAVKDLPKIQAVRDQNKVDVRIVTKDLINKEYALKACAEMHRFCNPENSVRL